MHTLGKQVFPTKLLADMHQEDISAGMFNDGMTEYYRRGVTTEDFIITNEDGKKETLTLFVSNFEVYSG